MGYGEWSDWIKDLSLQDYFRSFINAWKLSYTDTWMNDEWLLENITLCIELKGSRELINEIKELIVQVTNAMKTESRSIKKEDIIQESAIRVMNNKERKDNKNSKILSDVIECIANKLMYSLDHAPKGEVWIENYIESACVALCEFFYRESQKHGMIP